MNFSVRPKILHLDGVSWDDFEKWKQQNPPQPSAILTEVAYDKLPTVFDLENPLPWYELKTCCINCSLDVGERVFPIPTSCATATTIDVLTTGACSASCAMSYVLEHYHEKDRFTASRLINKIYEAFNGEPPKMPITAGLDTRVLTKFGGNTHTYEYAAYANRKF